MILRTLVFLSVCCPLAACHRDSAPPATPRTAPPVAASALTASSTPTSPPNAPQRQVSVFGGALRFELPLGTIAPEGEARGDEGPAPDVGLIRKDRFSVQTEADTLELIARDTGDARPSNLERYALADWLTMVGRRERAPTLVRPSVPDGGAETIALLAREGVTCWEYYEQPCVGELLVFATDATYSILVVNQVELPEEDRRAVMTSLANSVRVTTAQPPPSRVEFEQSGLGRVALDLPAGWIALGDAWEDGASVRIGPRIDHTTRPFALVFEESYPCEPGVVPSEVGRVSGQREGELFGRATIFRRVNGRRGARSLVVRAAVCTEEEGANELVTVDDRDAETRDAALAVLARATLTPIVER